MLSVLWLVGQPQPTGTPPTTSTPTVATLTTGACGVGHTIASAAQIRIAWTVTNPDGVNYDAKLYENGILLSTQAVTASMHYDKTIGGAVEGDAGHAWLSDWTYRLDIVRKSTSAVVDSQSSAPWEVQYGDCSGQLG